MESGNAFIPSIIGFILTAVWLPFFAILSVALSNHGLLHIHPLFGFFLRL